jgi:farnesyl diphosphate synthase
MHALKTGRADPCLGTDGAFGGGADAAALAQLDAFAVALGLAFQVRDDILDVESSSQQLGKTAGKDCRAVQIHLPGAAGHGRRQGQSSRSWI